jgi:predicted dehydrogenase
MVRWAILGAGTIAHRFARSLAHVEDAELVALSCRSAEKAAAFAGEFGIEPARAYSDGTLPGSGHEALLADPEVDAVYLALPHGLHHEWATRALRAGRPVLCEKPAALDAAQMADIARVSREAQTLFMEAMKTRFMPLYRRVRDMVDSGAIGEVTQVEATLCNDMRELVEGGRTYHSQPGQGGVLLDCGTYCASWLEDYLPGEFSIERADGVVQGGTDLYADATLAFGSARGRLECAFDRSRPRTATIRGTRGSVVVEELHRPQAATLLVDGREPRPIDAPYEVDDFFGEIDHFTRLVRSGAAESDVMPLAASVRDARIIDRVREALGG